MIVDLTRLWPRVEPILDAVLDLPESWRSARVEALCAGDPELARAVADLLRADRDGSGFLEAAPVEIFDPDSEELAGIDVGSDIPRIGPFRISARLGSGGMGTVLLGERDDGQFEQKVAIKIFNTNIAPASARETLVRERRILGRLEHPHIARIYDGGVTDAGDPYLVMEFVDGRPIDEHCEAERLGVGARLLLFLDVCRAVAYAHGRLVVHCDLKPRNILVTGAGEVKVVDFGISRRLEEEGQGLSRGDAKIMTPAYAAPEQVRGEPVTMATDVYQLGLVLSELLTGQRARGAGSDLDLEMPADRRVEADLDAIVRNALRSDPGQRYPSVQAMDDDLRRYLSDQPVTARSGSLGYRTSKFVRRHRGGVAAAGLVITAVLAGTAGFAWKAREASIQRDEARRHLSRATATREFTAFLLSVGAPEGKQFNVADLLEQGEILIDKQFAGDDALRAEMLVNVGEQYVQSQRWDKAAPVLERAAGIALRIGEPALEARALCPLAFLKILNGDRPEAEAMMSRAMAGLPDGPQYALQRAECLIEFSQFGFMTGEAAEMISRATAALEILERERVATPLGRINAQVALAYGYYLAHESRKADETYAKAMAALEAAGIGRTIAAAVTLNNWALVHFQGNIAKAEPLTRRVVELRRAIEGAGSVTPTATYNHAGVLLQLGRYAEAEPLYEETIRAADTRAERRVQFDAMIALAGLSVERGDLPRATARLARLEPFQDDPRFTSLRRAHLAYWSGRLAAARGDHASARARFAEAVEIYDANKEKIAVNVLALIGLARAEQVLGDGASATAAVERALALAESFIEPGGPSYLVGLSLIARGELEQAAGSSEAAEATFEKACEHLSQTLGPDHAATTYARGLYGQRIRRRIAAIESTKRSRRRRCTRRLAHLVRQPIRPAPDLPKLTVRLGGRRRVARSGGGARETEQSRGALGRAGERSLEGGL